MNFSARYLVALLGCLSLCAFASESDQDPAQAFHDKVELLFIEEFRAEIVSELVQSGVSELDAEEIFSRFATESIACVVTASRTAIERRGEEPDEVLSEIEPENIAELFSGEAEFEELAESCVLTAIANAGLES